MAEEIDGLALIGDVRSTVRGWVARPGASSAPIDLLVANAGRRGAYEPARDDARGGGGKSSRSTCSALTYAAAPSLGRMVERGGGRIVNVGSGASPSSRRPTSRRPTGRARRPSTGSARSSRPRVGRSGVSVFSISPGLVRSALTEELGDDAPWTPPELAPRLVGASPRASRRAGGRYIHAEHDDIEELIARMKRSRATTNAIRLGRCRGLRLVV